MCVDRTREVNTHSQPTRVQKCTHYSRKVNDDAMCNSTTRQLAELCESKSKWNTKCNWQLLRKFCRETRYAELYACGWSNEDFAFVPIQNVTSVYCINKTKNLFHTMHEQLYCCVNLAIFNPHSKFKFVTFRIDICGGAWEPISRMFDNKLWLEYRPLTIEIQNIDGIINSKTYNYLLARQPLLVLVSQQVWVVELYDSLRIFTGACCHLCDRTMNPAQY